jgi:hypothetical protein
MEQAKFSLEESQIAFINRFKHYGFKDKSTLVRTALARFQTDLERRQLQQSAELYAELYDADLDLQELTEAAIAEWPE